MTRILQKKTVALAVLLVVLPFVLHGAPFLGDAWVRVACFSMLYAMLALGLNIVVGYAGLLDLGYIGFYALGAYLYALLASPHLFSAGLATAPTDWPVWLILMLAAVLAGVSGALLGAPTLKLRGDYLAIVTLGFGEIIRIFVVNLDRPFDITSGSQGIMGIQPLHAGGISVLTTWSLGPVTLTPVINYYFVFLALVLLLLLVSHRLENSRMGRAWMALREDEVAAEATGLNKRNIKLLAFSMGAAFGGISGALFASFQQFVSPESFTLGESTMLLVMVVLGGMGSIPGVIIGAVLLTVLPEVLRDVIEWLHPLLVKHVTLIDPGIWTHLLDAGTLRMLIFGLALILMMRYRPEGLWRRRPRHAPHEQITIRSYQAKDYAEVNRVALDAFYQFRKDLDHWQGFVDVLAATAKLADDAELLVAEKNGVVIGSVGYVAPGRPREPVFEPDWGVIRMLSVHPDARGLGVGRRLVDACIQRAQRDGVSILGLHTSPIFKTAVRLYQQMGFVHHQDLPDRRGAPCTVYVRPIGQEA